LLGAAQLIDQPVVFGMRTNPEPNNLVALHDSQGSNSEAYPGRVDIASGVNFLESQ
jgi:hypothetical protein